MNNIISMYHSLRNVKELDELADVLFSEFGMPRLKTYSGTSSLLQGCKLLAKDWVRHQYALQLRSRATVPEMELQGNIDGTALMFYAILKAGDVKTLYLVKPDASEFINATAFTQKLEPTFFVKNFDKPLVLYSGEPRTLFDDVLCIELFYNGENKTLECLLSCADQNLPSREFCRCIPVEELSGVFTVDIFGQEELGESSLFMLRQGIIDSIEDLDHKFYDAIKYALKFLLLKESDKQPLLVEKQFSKKKANVETQKKIFGKIDNQRISLTTEYRKTMLRHSGDEKLVLDKEGKTLRGISVRGFLRRQHYGPGNSLVKIIYVDAHESHSWIKDGIRIVKVVK